MDRDKQIECMNNAHKRQEAIATKLAEHPAMKAILKQYAREAGPQVLKRA